MSVKVFQVSNKPILANNLIRTDDFIREYKHIFNDVWAVTTSAERTENIKWLESAREGLMTNPDKSTVTLVSKTDYFKVDFDELKRMINQLSSLTLEDFATEEVSFNLADSLFKLDDLLENDDGLYFYDSRYDLNILNPAQTFVRYKWQNGETLYIGSILISS